MHTSPTSAELNTLNERFLDNDCIEPSSLETYGIRPRPRRQHDAHEHGLTSDTLDGEAETNPTSSSIRLKPHDLKIEVPLTPEAASKGSKSVSFSDILEDVQTFAPPMPIDDDAESDGAYEKIFDNIIEAKALQANHDLENEQLQEAGLEVETRVKVPVLDFSVPEAPWMQRESEKMTADEIKELTVPISKMSLHRWPGLAKYDAGPSSLPWSPFPMRLAEVASTERLEYSEVVESLLDVSGYEEAIAIDSLTWKADGLRILDEDSDADDLEPAIFEKPTDLQSLLRKRKLALGDGQQSTRIESPLLPLLQTKNHQFHTVAGVSNPRQQLLTEGQVGQPAALRQEPSKDGGSLFGAQNSLSRFMEMQGHKAKKPRMAEQSLALPPQPIATPSPPMQADTSAPDLEPRLPAPFSAPPANENLESRGVIVSATLMKDRSLIRQSTVHAPFLDLIERDWTARLTATEADHTKRSAISAHDEGDFIVSPSMGIVCTSLQKVKQKPLPGHGTEPLLKQRIRIVAARFEQLVVLVGLGDLNGAGGDTEIGDADCVSLLELIDFCTGLDDDIAVYVVAGGDEGMTRWIAGLVSQTEGARDVRLLPDETLVSACLTTCP